MATKTFYVLAQSAVTPNFFGKLQENGSAPAGANAAFGWTPGSSGVAFWRARLGAASADTANQASSFIDSTSGPTKGTGATNTTAGDSFISPVAYIGTFADAAWTFSWVVRATTTGAIGRVRMRVWASVNADGSSPRELTSGTQVGSTITLNALTTDFTSTITWSPGPITLANEFLFFQLEWNVTSAGSTSANVLFRQSTALITTPDFELNTPSIPNVYAQVMPAWTPLPVTVLSSGVGVVPVEVDNPPIGNAPEFPSLSLAIRTWEPDLSLYEHFGANGPYKPKQIYPSILAIAVSNPPVQSLQSRLSLSSTVGSWEPDPSLYEFFGANAPFNTRRLAPPLISLVINNPPIASIRVQEQVNGTWQADPAAFQFLGGRGPFLPLRIPASLLAVAVNAPPIVLPQTERPYDNWWIPSDPLPQFHPIIPQGPPNPSFGIPAPSTWTILSAWNPPDAQAPIAGKINPVFLAIAVNNPPVSSNADNQLVAGGYWPSLPDPNPTLSPTLPVSVTTVAVNNPPVSSNADNQLAAGGYWPALPDPNPTLRPPLPVSITAVTVSNPPVLYETVFQSWAPPDPQVLPPRLNPALGAVAVNNPPTGGLNTDNQLAAGGYWPAPTFTALFQTRGIVGVEVDAPPVINLEGYNQLAAGGYWPTLPDPLPTLPRYLPTAATGGVVNNPPPTQAIGANQLAAGGYWPALPDPNPTLPRYLPASVTTVEVDNPPLGVFSLAPDQLGVVVSYAWEAAKVTVVFGHQVVCSGPVLRVDNPPSYSHVRTDVTILGAWEPPPPPLVAISSQAITAPFIQPPSGQPFGNSAYLQVFATFGPVATSLTWLQLPPALLDTAVNNPSFGGAPDATQAILAYWQQPDPAPILPRLPVQPFVPVVQLVSEVTPLETILTSWQPPDLPQQKVKRRFFFTAGAPVPPVAPTELVEVRENWRVDRASWPADTPAPVVARPLNPAFLVGPAFPPPQRREVQVGIATGWAPPDPWVPRQRQLSPATATVQVSNPPLKGGALANLVGVLSSAWIAPDVQPQRQIPPLPVIVVPSVAGRSRLAAFIYTLWAAPDVPVQPRVLLPQAAAVFIPRSSSLPSLLSVLGAWADPPPAILVNTPPQVQGTAVFLPSPSPPSPLETILLSSWTPADLPPTLARQQVPPTQIGGQNARVSSQVATVLAAWADGPPLPVALRYLPTGVTAVVVSPPVLTGQYLDNLITVLSFWVPSSFDPWFTGIPLGQPLPPPIPPIPHGTAVFEALGSPHELGSTLRAGLGALSRS